MVVLFAGVKGFIDRVDVNKVTAYEKAWLNHIKASHKVGSRQKSGGVTHDRGDSTFDEVKNSCILAACSICAVFRDISTAWIARREN